MELTHRKIIVVGGSSGMGLAVVRAVLSRGAEVTAVGRSAERLARVASELGVKTIAADVTREDEVRQLYETVGNFGQFLVTPASNPPSQTIPELDLDAARPS